MFNRILLPLDGSNQAECTLVHALALAKLNGTEIVPLLVLEENSSETGVDPMEWHVRKTTAQTYIDAIGEILRERGFEANCLLLTGSPYQRIMEQVDKLDIDLILISSHGQSGRTERPFGAISQKLLEGTRTSIMLIPAHKSTEENEPFTAKVYSHILVPLDGSLRAECVLPIASRIASEQNSEIVLAHVVQLPDVLGWNMLADDTRKVAEDFVQHIESVAQSYLDQLLERQNINPSSVIVQADNPAIALCQIAEQQQVDLILVSAHGASANPMRSIGDTAHSLLVHCHQPLLIYQDRPQSHALAPETAPLREQDERPIGYSPLSGATIP